MEKDSQEQVVENIYVGLKANDKKALEKILQVVQEYYHDSQFLDLVKEGVKKYIDEEVGEKGITPFGFIPAEQGPSFLTSLHLLVVLKGQGGMEDKKRAIDMALDTLKLMEEDEEGNYITLNQAEEIIDAVDNKIPFTQLASYNYLGRPVIFIWVPYKYESPSFYNYLINFVLNAKVPAGSNSELVHSFFNILGHVLLCNLMKDDSGVPETFTPLVKLTFKEEANVREEEYRGIFADAFALTMADETGFSNEVSCDVLPKKHRAMFFKFFQLACEDPDSFRDRKTFWNEEKIKKIEEVVGQLMASPEGKLEFFKGQNT